MFIQCVLVIAELNSDDAPSAFSSQTPFPSRSPTESPKTQLRESRSDPTVVPSSQAENHPVVPDIKPSGFKTPMKVEATVNVERNTTKGWAQALRDIPIFGTTHADHLPTAVPCTEWMSDERIAGDYELETGRQIVDCFRQRQLNPEEVEMALVGGHGPFTWGKNAEKAVYNARVLEELARMAQVTVTVNPEAKTLKPAIIDRHYRRKHGKDAYYGQQ